jgi:hypothetical protein
MSCNTIKLTATLDCHWHRAVPLGTFENLPMIAVPPLQLWSRHWHWHSAAVVDSSQLNSEAVESPTFAARRPRKETAAALLLGGRQSARRPTE